jgi:predicted alpha/beta-fold hydrolase
MIGILDVALLVLGALVGYVISFLLSFRGRNSQECDERRRVLITQSDKVFPIPDDIEHTREWVPNSRGVLLCRQSFVPGGYVRAVIGICHGFGDHSQDFLTELAIKFCRNGFAVISMDAEGHGYALICV